MQRGLENVQKCQELKDSVEEKINKVEEKIAGEMEKDIARVEDIKKKLLASGNATNESKFVPADSLHMVSSAVPLTAPPISVNLSTYDGKTNW
ncbi:hypothetical protein TNCV_3197331 [Trichonephila clavipes]|nr:hypothetical protein TNCV_3197331 [Trichonephila clavipes]